MPVTSAFRRYRQSSRSSLAEFQTSLGYVSPPCHQINKTCWHQIFIWRKPAVNLWSHRDSVKHRFLNPFFICDFWVALPSLLSESRYVVGFVYLFLFLKWFLWFSLTILNAKRRTGFKRKHILVCLRFLTSCSKGFPLPTFPWCFLCVLQAVPGCRRDLNGLSGHLQEQLWLSC